MQRFTLLPNHFNWKEQYCFVIEFVIEFPIEREFARRYLRCLIKYSKFTSLHVWCLVIIVELKPFLITCNALNCIFKRDTEKEKEKKKNRNKTQENVLRVFCFCLCQLGVCTLGEEGKTSFEHSWCMLYVLPFKIIFNDFLRLIKDGNKCKKGFLETQ